jgi:hypothetical protein
MELPRDPLSPTTQRLLDRVSSWPLTGPLNFIARAFCYLVSEEELRWRGPLKTLAAFTGLGGAAGFMQQARPLCDLRHIARDYREENHTSLTNDWYLAGESGYIEVETKTRVRSDANDRLWAAFRTCAELKGSNTFRETRANLMKEAKIRTKNAYSRALARVKKEGKITVRSIKTELDGWGACEFTIVVENRKPRSAWDLNVKARKIVKPLAAACRRDPMGFATALDVNGFSYLVSPDFKTCAAAAKAKHPYWSTKLRNLQSRAKRW